MRNRHPKPALPPVGSTFHWRNKQGVLTIVEVVRHKGKRNCVVRREDGTTKVVSRGALFRKGQRIT